MSFAPMFQSKIPSQTYCIRYTYVQLMLENKLNLQPVYQRGECWTASQKSELIDTVMNNIPLHVFLLYHHKEDYECLDGQNRLVAFKEYIEQTPDYDKPNSDDNGLFFWKPDPLEYVYYQQNDAITEWVQKKISKRTKRSRQINYRPMTQEEKRNFDSFDLTILTITYELTVEKRRIIFRKYQNGTSISGWEKFITDPRPIVFNNYVHNNNLKAKYLKPISDMLSSDDNSFLWDLYRMSLVFMKHEHEHKINYSMIGSNLRNKLITPRGEYDLKEEDYDRSFAVLDEFMTKFTYFRDYLSDVKQKLKPTLSVLISLTYIWFNSAPAIKSQLENSEITLKRLQHIIENDDIEKNTLNNDDNAKDALEVFPVIKEILESTVPPAPVAILQKVGKALRIPCWNKYIGANVAISKCLCCDESPMQQGTKSWEAAHVEARKGPKKGENTLDNLRPICIDCNREMGTQNMRDYMIAHGYATARAFP